ncbi:hypothetical protein [Paenibacillus sp. MMO-58]|uniref:hypothetical protein n=1 Tax=Paenibacillus sp. MMO-58 TaxID=3081290 RepID=UPI003015B440
MMNPLTFIGAFGVLIALLQLTIPDVLLSLKPFGVRTKEAVKAGGFITLPAGIVMIIVSLVM